MHACTHACMHVSMYACMYLWKQATKQASNQIKKKQTFPKGPESPTYVLLGSVIRIHKGILSPECETSTYEHVTCFQECRFRSRGVSKSIPKKSTCKIRVTSVTLPTSTRGVNVDGIGQIRIHSLDQIEDNIESYESIKGSSIVKAMILESNLIIPNDKHF